MKVSKKAPYQVAINLMNKALKDLFLKYFPNPEKVKRGEKDPYGAMRMWFSSGKTVDLLNDDSNQKYEAELKKVAGLERLVDSLKIPKGQKLLFMELALHGLAEYQVLNKDIVEQKMSFRDLLANMFDEEEDGDDGDNFY